VFEGQHETGIDPKGRVGLLQRYREQFEDTVTVFKRKDHVVVTTPGHFDKLVGFAGRRLSFEHEQGVRSFFDAKLQRDRRYFFGNKFDLAFDGQGRLTIPKTLRDAVDLNTDVVWVGCGEYLELWAKKHYVADCARWEQAGGFDMMFGSGTPAPNSPPADLSDPSLWGDGRDQD
jgi:MraZ protein